MAPQEMAGEQFRVYWSADDYVRCDLTDGAEVSGEDALEQLEAIASVAGGVAVPTLVDLRRTRSVSREARSIFASSVGATRIALYTESSLSRVIANFFIGVSGPSVPTKVFTDLSAAEEWLADDE